MKYRDGHDLIARYLRVRSRAMAPRGMQVAQRGRSYAGQCSNPKCRRKGHPIGQRDPQGDIVMRCRSCGTPWAFSDVFTLAGQSHAGRGWRPPRSVLDTGDLCRFAQRLLEAKSLEPGHGEVFMRYVREGRSQRDLAGQLTVERFMGQDWHTRDVRRACERAKAFLERDLARRGVLDR